MRLSRPLLACPRAAGTFVLVLLVACKAHYVDTKAATVLAEKYFSSLEQGNVEDALAMYSVRFRQEHEKTWRDLLLGLQGRYGSITEFKLLETGIVPVSGIGCSLLLYEVRRGTLGSNEKLVICEAPSSGAAIAGHELIRVDTQQKIVAGVAVEQQKIISR